MRRQETPGFEDISEIGERFKLRNGSRGRRISERVREGTEAMDNPIIGRWRRDGAVGMAKFNRVQNNLALGVHLDEFEATIRIEGRPNVETFFGAIIPGATRGRLGMDENTTTNLLNPPNEDSPIGGKKLPPAKYWPLVY